MSKVICEICGTVYPDNATVCPICGYPRNIGETEENTLEEETVAAQTAQRVRGGRFSNSNVKKRNQAAQSEERSRAEQVSREPVREPDEPEKNTGSNRGLVITTVILLLAVICVGAYIGLRFFWGADAYDQAAANSNTTEATETVPVDTAVACTDIQLGAVDLNEGVEFLGMGRAWRLNVTVVPANATDELTISSSDPSVATAGITNGQIEIVSVAPGSATITVSCGAVSKQFPVLCSFNDPSEETEESTVPSESSETTEETEQTTETTQPGEIGTLVLNRSDITFRSKDESFTFSADGVSNGNITWSSSDESIVTIVNGKATAVGSGTATITATYNGQKASCIVRCVLPARAASTGSTDSTEAPETSESTQPTESTDAADPTASS